MTAPKFTVTACVSVSVRDKDGRPVAEIDVYEEDGPLVAVKALAESVLAITTERVIRMLAADFGEPEADEFPEMAASLNEAALAMETERLVRSSDEFPTVSPDVEDVDLTSLPVDTNDIAPDDLSAALAELINSGFTAVKAFDVHAVATRRGALLSATTIAKRLTEVARGRWTIPGLLVTHIGIDQRTGENIYGIAKAAR